MRISSLQTDRSAWAMWLLLALLSGALATSLTAAEPVAQSQGPVVSLVIESRAQVPGKEPGTFEIVYGLLNTSNKAVVAWNFGCVNANQAGHGVIEQVGNDSFSTFEKSLAGLPNTNEMFILPGGRAEQKIRFAAAKLDGPNAAKTCGPILAILEDATFEGDETQARYWFEERKKTAVEAGKARREIRAALANQKPLIATLDDILDALTADLLPGATRGLPANHIASFHQSLLKGEPITPEEVLADLDFYYNAAMKHLPPNWQNEVLGELE